MLKKYSTKIGSLVIVLCSFIIYGCYYYIVEASILKSGHDLLSKQIQPMDYEGACSYCHVPHSAIGKRLWRDTVDTTYEKKRALGEVGVLCYTCHWPERKANAPSVESTIFMAYDSAQTHPLVDNDSAPDTRQRYSGWAYTNDTTDDDPATYETTYLQCTSCHDVHEQNNGIQPINPYTKKGNFLRAPMYKKTKPFNPKPNQINEFDSIFQSTATTDVPALFCSFCHLERAYESTGKGTHPINVYNSTCVYIDFSYRVSETTAVIPWYDTFEVGGHLSYFETGTVICNTCHKAHGAAPGGTLLVKDNRLQRGERYSSNALCEACHEKAPSLHDTTRYPYNKYKSHPVDSSETWDFKSARGNRDLYINIPKGWPTIDPVNGRGIACLSCHKVHRAQLETRMLRGGKEKGDKRICDDCHCPDPKKPSDTDDWGKGEDSTNPLLSKESWPDAPENAIFYGPESHPVHVQLNVTDDMARTWPNNDWLRLFDTGGRVFNAEYESTRKKGYLSCETCHNVHRAYSNTALIEYPGDDYSEICVGCHTDYKRLTAGRSWVGARYSTAKYIDPDRPSARYFYFTRDTDTTGGYFSMLSYKEDSSVFGANPSSYILEYNSSIIINAIAADDDAANLAGRYVEKDVIDRLGTHPSGVRIDYPISGDSTTLLRPAECISIGSDPNPKPGYVFYDTWNLRKEWSNKYPDAEWLKNYGFSNQQSRWGISSLEIDSDTTRQRFIICQSCHTPHGAAKGLVEYNRGAKGRGCIQTYDTDATPNSALLLGNNIDSNLCTACHRNLGSKSPADQIVNHVLSVRLCDSSSYLWNATKHRLLDLFGLGENIMDRSLPANYPKPAVGKIQWDETTIIKGTAGATHDDPAIKLVCDSCHAPHAAETSSGSLMLDSRKPVDTTNIMILAPEQKGSFLYDSGGMVNADENTRRGGKRVNRLRYYKNAPFFNTCHNDK
ncbi:MAG: hypothetical protein HY934_08430 [Candidatus Firestonebacteria bacterium]|nr:hypothetical protein [Candidatus Firestonebacteria bacterium]